jgi:hypothetical protein
MADVRSSTRNSAFVSVDWNVAFLGKVCSVLLGLWLKPRP